MIVTSSMEVFEQADLYKLDGMGRVVECMQLEVGVLI